MSQVDAMSAGVPGVGGAAHTSPSTAGFAGTHLAIWAQQSSTPTEQGWPVE